MSLNFLDQFYKYSKIDEVGNCIPFKKRYHPNASKFLNREFTFYGYLHHSLFFQKSSW